MQIFIPEMQRDFCSLFYDTHGGPSGVAGCRDYAWSAACDIEKKTAVLILRFHRLRGAAACFTNSKMLYLNARGISLSPEWESV